MTLLNVNKPTQGNGDGGPPPKRVPDSVTWVVDVAPGTYYRAPRRFVCPDLVQLCIMHVRGPLRHGTDARTAGFAYSGQYRFHGITRTACSLL